MLVNFEELPLSSRLWVYQADRVLNTEEIATIVEMTEKFLENWAAHGAPLKSSYQVCYDMFLIIAVDEAFNTASGCSIDASVGLIRAIQQALDIDLMDRTKVCYQEGDRIVAIPMADIKSSIADGKLKSTTPTFNNLIQSVGDFENNWIIPAENSWIKRYF